MAYILKQMTSRIIVSYIKICIQHCQLLAYRNIAEQIENGLHFETNAQSDNRFVYEHRRVQFRLYNFI
jgi:hypothetical protein